MLIINQYGASMGRRSSDSSDEVNGDARGCGMPHPWGRVITHPETYRVQMNDSKKWIPPTNTARLSRGFAQSKRRDSSYDMRISRLMIIQRQSRHTATQTNTTTCTANANDANDESISCAANTIVRLTRIAQTTRIVRKTRRLTNG